MQREPSDPGATRWRTLAVFAAAAFLVNLALAASILRLSLIERLTGVGGTEIVRAARDVVEFLIAFPLELASGNGEAIVVLAVAIAFLASQILFLLPWTAPRPEIGTGRGWPLGISAASAGLVGAALAVSLIYGLGEALVQALISWVPNGAWGNEAVEVLDRAPIFRWLPISTEWLMLAPLLGLVPLWILCGVLLGRITSVADPRRPEAQLRRLFAGSLASIVLMVPFDVLARKRGVCICVTGTWVALCVGFLALLWMAGPAVVLLLSRRRRLAWRREACLACGYSRRGHAGDRCPECGSTHPVEE